jgi:hypothetical protein
MSHIQYFSLIFLILKGNDFICIGLIFSMKFCEFVKTRSFVHITFAEKKMIEFH